MRRLINIMSAVFLSVLVSNGQEARSLPELPADPSITVGTLPNGVAFYFAGDKRSKGFFNISLVQKTNPELPVEELSMIAGKRFSSVNFGSVKLDDFLARNGILPTEKGYIDCREGSVSYTFEHFASPRGDAVLDTLLLSVFRLAQAAAQDGQPSSAQAVVIAGDFNPGTMLPKMKTLCLINPQVSGDIEPRKRERPSHARSEISITGAALSRVSVKWNMASTPAEHMATVLPVISGKLSAELGRLVLGRLYRACNNAGLDVWIDLDNEDSFTACGNESMTVTINCPGRDKDNVARIMKNEIDRLYTYGVDEKEYSYVRDGNKYAWIARSKNMHPDLSAVTERCKAAFLYGASLSTDAERIRFAYRDLPDSVQTRFFNSYMRGVIVQTAETDNSLLSDGSNYVGHGEISEILSGYAGASTLKNPKDKDEYLTGGVMWTFSNGVNVIFKEMDTRGMLYYSYAARGGRQYASEGLFDTIDGVSGEEFGNFIASEGIEMRLGLNPTDVRLYGKAASENVETLLQILSAISGNRGNGRIFGGDSYKLLVVVGDIGRERFKRLMRSYAVTLGQGSRWKAVKYSEENTDDLLELRHFTLYDKLFPFDVSAYNYAVAAVAYYGLRDKLALSFSDCAVSFLLRQGYCGFPLNSYRTTYGIRSVSPDHFSSLRDRLPEEQAQLRLRKLVSDLAAGQIPADVLAVYKQIAGNEFESWRNLPDFYIQSAMDRYMDNRDLLPRFNTQLNAVTAESLKNFYVAASASNR